MFRLLLMFPLSPIFIYWNQKIIIHKDFFNCCSVIICMLTNSIISMKKVGICKCKKKNDKAVVAAECVYTTSLYTHVFSFCGARRVLRCRFLVVYFYRERPKPVGKTV